MNGKYVVKMGEYYICKALEYSNSADIILERGLKDAKLMNLEGAKRLKEKIGGEIVKLKVEMEPVE